MESVHSPREVCPTRRRQVSGGSRTGRVAERLRRAIADGGLVEEGYLRRRPGAGTFVTQRPVMRNNLERNFGVTRLIETFGLEAGTLEQHLAVEPADAETAEALQIAEGDPVNVLRRVRTAEDVPVVYSVDHWSPELVGDAELDDATSIYQVLRDHG